MLVLPHIFKSGALFQQNSSLTLPGITAAGATVTAVITDRKGCIFSAADVTADDTDTFALTLSTPRASLDIWDITVCTGDERHVMHDVLFGELWLASGQSNMELEIVKQPDAEPFF